MPVILQSTAFATETVTTTTGTSGNIQLSQAVRNGTFITAHTVGTPSAILLPFRDRNGAIYLKALHWDTTTLDIYASTELTYTVVYKPA